MPLVFFSRHNKQILVPEGTLLLHAARQAGIFIESPCNKEGTCGKCKVLLHRDDLAGVRHEKGFHSVTTEDQQAGYVLSCQVFINEDVRVEIPDTRQPLLKIIADGKCRMVKLDPVIKKKFDPESDTTTVTAGEHILQTETGDTTATIYGLAIDIGTTTLVVSLIDLKTGEALRSNVALNPQALHAQDVLSRIKIGSTDEGLSLLHKELLQELNRMIGELAASVTINRSTIYEAVLSGNTTMLTLTAGTSPSSLGKYPYRVELNTAFSYASADLGLHIAEKGSIWFPPVASAYVGADITAGIMAADLSRLKGVTLFVDIGTNGEMVLAENGKITATSSAAGPAFEGMNISSGMRAVAGAIEKVSICNGAVASQTISGSRPLGLCGSGLIDAVAELTREEIIDRNGRFVKPGSELFTFWQSNLEVENGRTQFRLAENVTLTQQDIRQVQLAKAAIRAGIDMMLQTCSINPDDVNRVFIAGSFGAHLKVSSLITLGLLPEIFFDRVEFVGNTSQSGSAALLLNRELRSDAAKMVAGMVVLELSREAAFEKIFLKALALPQLHKKHNKDLHGV